ncbi:MAG: hypothetical protein LBT54_04405 [Bifidobacteriaceae bacterium]|nr:hypothetical protein [Bifidobacteriaceae bacterium]
MVGVVVDGDGVGVAGCNVVRTGLSAGLLDQEIAISSQAGGLFSITLMPGLWELKAVCLDGAAGVSAPVRVPDQGTVRVRIVAAAATPGAATRAAKPKAATAPAAPVIKGAKPKIAGKAVVGRKLKAKAGTWTAGVDLSYRWYRDGKAIAKATKASYKVKAADKGKRISVKVTAAKAGHASVTKASAKKKIK